MTYRFAFTKVMLNYIPQLHYESEDKIKLHCSTLSEITRMDNFGKIRRQVVPEYSIRTCNEFDEHK